MSWDTLGGEGVTCWASDVDSARFGMSVARLAVGWQTEPSDAVDAEIVARCRDVGADVVVARWPAHHVRTGAALVQAGFALLPADNLVYWERTDASRVEWSFGEAEPAVDIGSLVDLPDLSGALPAVVELIFTDYSGHFAANPRFSPRGAAKGYAEWAERRAASDPDRCLVMRSDGVIVGVATTCVLSDGTTSEIELAGMVPGWRGRGLYRHLLHAAALLGHDGSPARTVISTQVANIAAQRVWAAAGFRPMAAFTTTHVMTVNGLPRVQDAAHE